MRRNFKRDSKALKIVQRDVPGTSLDVRNEGSV
jgi:hypothetical protein